MAYLHFVYVVFASDGISAGGLSPLVEGHRPGSYLQPRGYGLSKTSSVLLEGPRRSPTSPA